MAPQNYAAPQNSSEPPPYALMSPPNQLQDLETPPSWCGMPLKYISLITLAVQNAALTIIMHHSRVSTPPSRAYSAASAVLLNELLKGFISLAIAVSRIDKPQSARKLSTYLPNGAVPLSPSPMTGNYAVDKWLYRFRRVGREVFSEDCWKLAIPAILYVIQNNLQYVAAANLDVATFTVTYQMKILTTAAFSVAMLRRKLGPTKWLALFFLAIGVGIVQLQVGLGRSTSNDAAIMSTNGTVSLSDEEPSLLAAVHSMHHLKGFLAVVAACFTSGAAGVYFEMVLKNSKADLWVRNVQLSLFSLLPALVPIIFSKHPPDSAGWFWDLFRNFGVWAWATVAVQVFGGLVTAVVIKYSDNILKGFATSLSIIISFLASVALFDFKITPHFVLGASTVLFATFLYQKPTGKTPAACLANRDSNSPILGQLSSSNKRFSLTQVNARGIATAFGINHSRSDSQPLTEMHIDRMYGQFHTHSGAQTPFYSSSPSPSPPSSIPPTRPPSAPRPVLGPIDTQNVSNKDGLR
ncbi:hypothetical protein M422DRAFT_47409 [Sphaerobolus stellatus SS14]|uniref:UDP-galactose transporter n=1 Tax=Sphaerobolus stellatus (strain SS14) TaxID=990650 RepID=A0A0C9VBI0_SPHS4|nr:hypothetical protein M422DRAFT_47409 [Sphaerobolus stellatus SS14]